MGIGSFFGKVFGVVKTVAPFAAPIIPGGLAASLFTKAIAGAKVAEAAKNKNPLGIVSAANFLPGPAGPALEKVSGKIQRTPLPTVLNGAHPANALLHQILNQTALGSARPAEILAKIENVRRFDSLQQLAKIVGQTPGPIKPG